MAGRKLHRWVFSWLCQWFPGRARGRRRPIFRQHRPMVEKLEDRWSPTSINVTPSAELGRPHFSSADSYRVATVGDSGKSSEGIEEAPNREISLSLSSPPPADDSVTTAAKVQAQQPAASSMSSQQNGTATDAMVAHLSSRPFTPLSTPPKPTPSAMANGNPNGGGGAARSGASTPHAGMGGGGPTGGGGGPGMVNANNFIGVNFGQPDTAATPTPGFSFQSAFFSHASSDPAAGSAAAPSAPLNATTPSPSPQPEAASPPHGKPNTPNVPGGADPLYVIDLNTGETIPANATLNSFENWSENLLAQVSGATVSSYSWNTSQAPGLTSISGTTTDNLQGTWKSTASGLQTLSVTETPTTGSPLTMTFSFNIASTSSSRPTSSGSWPHLLDARCPPEPASHAAGRP